MNPPPPRVFGRLIAATALTATLMASAWATEYGYTSNRGGDSGRRLVLSTDLAGRPCVSTSTGILWADTGRRSVTIALDQNFANEPYVWASIRSDAYEPGCGAGAGEYCLGAARMSATGTTPSRYWVQKAYTSVQVAPAAIGQTSTSLPSVYKWVTGNKTGLFQKWHRSGVSAPLTDDLRAYEPSRIAAVSSTLAVATDAGELDCSNSVNAKVRLLEWSASPVIERDSERVGNADDYFKPEGIYVRDIDPSQCSGGYQSVAYVTDFCGALGENGSVLAFGIDETNKTLTPTSVKTLPQDCNPSAVTWHAGTGKLFVLCQTSDKIIPVTLTDPCNLDAVGTAVDLYHATADSNAPSCNASPAPITEPCGGTADPVCSPHDFAWMSSPSAYSDWLFVTLYKAQQVIMVKASDPTVQRAFYGTLGGTFSGYFPNDIEIASVP